MPKFIKKPEIVEAVQWFKYGDHPGVSRLIASPKMNTTRCSRCGRLMQDHGRFTIGFGYHVVCPGDWIVNRQDGRDLPRLQQWKADDFEAVHEKIDDPPTVSPRLASPDDSTILCEPNFGDCEQVNDQEEDHDVS